MRILKYILFNILTVVVMVGCSNNSDFSSLSEIEKIDKTIETIEDFMEPVISECDEVGDLGSVLGQINELEGVENAWIEENGLCIKVENGGVLVWLFTPEEVSIDYSIASFLTRGIKESRNTDSDVRICKNQKICIINQFSEDPSRKGYIELYDNFKKDLINKYNFKENEVEIINAEKLTLDFITNELPQYGVIFFATHGGYINNKHWLLTGSPFVCEVETKDKWVADSIEIFYLTFEDPKTGQKRRAQYVGINEDFLSKHSANYPDNSIMFCTACQSLKGNNNLAKIFQSKNLGCFVGYNEENYQGKQLGIYFLENLIVTNATVSEEFLRSKSRFDEVEIFSTNQVKGKHSPAKLMCYPNECNIVLRRDIGEITEAVQTKNPKCAKDSVFFSYNVTASYFNANANVKEWGIALYKGEEVNRLYPVSNVAEITQNVDLSFYLLKEQLNLDYNNYVATPKEEWSVGVYEVNDKGVTLYSRNKAELKLIYDQKPSITILDLEVGETIDIKEGQRDRQIFYKFKWKSAGTLFMEEYYEYLDGNWTNKGKGESWALYDGTWYLGKHWVKFPSKRKPGSAYFYYEGIVDGKTIKSTNYLQFDFNGKNCSISLVNGTVDSRSRSISNNIPAKLSSVEMSLVRCVE